MKTSPLGLYAIARHEGIVPAPYLDPVGVWTFGIGHAETSGLAPNPRHMPKGMPEIPDQAVREAFDLFKRRIATYEEEVRRAVKVPLAQHEFDALVGFHFNTGAIARASATRVLNEGGDKREVARRLKLYNKAGGRVMQGLVKRRAEEVATFLAGDYGQGSVPVFSVTAKNKVGRVIQTFTKEQVLDMLGGSVGWTAPGKPAPRPAEAPAQGVSGTYARGFVAALWRVLWRWLKRKLTGGKA